MLLRNCLQTIQPEWHMSKIVRLSDLSMFFNVCYLSHEASVWEPKPEAGDEDDAAAGGHEPGLPVKRLPDGRGRREVEEHQEVGHGGRHKAQDQYWLPPLSRCNPSDKSK